MPGVWEKINDPLFSLMKEILSLKAATPAGFAVQAKAVVYVGSELWDVADEHFAERRFIEAACAFCNITPWPIAREGTVMTEIITLVPRQSHDAKLAEAFRDLEPVVLDLERAAKIAHRMFIDPAEEDIVLGIFAVEQFHKIASDLVRLWDEKHAAAR